MAGRDLIFPFCCLDFCHRETLVALSSVRTMARWHWWVWSAGVTGAARKIRQGCILVSPTTSIGSVTKWRQAQLKWRETAKPDPSTQWVNQQTQIQVHLWEERQGDPQESDSAHLLIRADGGFKPAGPLLQLHTGLRLQLKLLSVALQS